MLANDAKEAALPTERIESWEQIERTEFSDQRDHTRRSVAFAGKPVALLWFAAGLRRVLDRLSGGDPLAHAIVPAAALFGGLMIAGVSLDVSSAITAFATDEFTPDPDTARVLGTTGLIVALTGLTGGAAMVAVTTRIARKARALPTWAVWVSYAVAVLCLSSFWSGGMASVAFALWLNGAVIGVLRAARRTTPAPAVPAQGAPAPEAAPHAPDLHQRLTPYVVHVEHAGPFDPTGDDTLLCLMALRPSSLGERRSVCLAATQGIQLMNTTITASAGLLLAGVLVSLGAVTGAASASTNHDFSRHVRDCQQNMGFDGTMNPGMHQGRSGWDPTHVC